VAATIGRASPDVRTPATSATNASASAAWVRYTRAGLRVAASNAPPMAGPITSAICHPPLFHATAL
jgi:hypothetical protein